jgi:hypothetical protein
MKISVLGSCVSRVSLLRGRTNEHGIVNGEQYNLELEYYLDKHNLALALLPPPFSEEEVNTITKEMLWDKSRDVSLRQQLLKQTVPMLLNAESEYLVMDFYDFHNFIYAYQDTAFSTQACEFCNTPLYQKYKEDLKIYNLLELPTWLLYGMVDRFFDTILPKFDSDHLILNRFRANSYLLNTDGRIIPIPDEFKRPFQCHEKYNEKCRALEEHVIQKYNPYVIDISGYFMGDANLWTNWNASHFEKEFYRETYDQIIRIVTGANTPRYYNKVRLFQSDRDGYEEDKKRNFNVEWGINMLKKLMEEEDALWLNVLELLWIHAPQDPRVLQYMNLAFD